jgi:ferredoxin-NADP reductase
LAEKKFGTVIHRHAFSDVLELFRVVPDDGSKFPEYKSGQYIALSRDNCRLTKKITDGQGMVKYIPDLDEAGRQKRGQVTHSYSISSAPYETQTEGFLEFYVVLEKVDMGVQGRLSESLFSLDPDNDNKIFYMNKIVGEFTLDKRAAGFRNVVMIATGTGLAPFASMVKQLDYEAKTGKASDIRYTLFHANRTREELGYHEVFRSIEAAKKFDFAYVPSVSRPTPHDLQNPGIGKGRANNLLRAAFSMPTKEEQALQEAKSSGKDPATAEKAFQKLITPVLPQQHSPASLMQRMNPKETVVLTCGNPNGMADIKYICEKNTIRCEIEEW